MLNPIIYYLRYDGRDSLAREAGLPRAHPVTDIREVNSLILDSPFRAVLSYSRFCENLKKKFTVVYRTKKGQ